MTFLYPINKKMRKFTKRPSIGQYSFKLLEDLVKGTLPESFKEFMDLYGGVSIEEDYFYDSKERDWSYKDWTFSRYFHFHNMYRMAESFKKEYSKLLIPFCFDAGGRPYCISFQEPTYGKVIIFKDPEEIVEWDKNPLGIVADSFDELLDGLTRDRPDYL